MANEDRCGVCGLRGELVCCDRCPSSFHYSVSATQCIGSTRADQRAQWFCPPCTNARKIEIRAAAERWPEERKVQVLEKIKHQRRLQGSTKPTYDDPLPELKVITDFLDESSEEDIEDYRLTRVGELFQARLPLYGQRSYPSEHCYRVWEAGRLRPERLEAYLQRAREAWQHSYLQTIKSFSESDACTLLHLKNYDEEAALTTLSKERVPFIGVCEHEGVVDAKDLENLRKGVALRQSGPAHCHKV